MKRILFRKQNDFGKTEKKFEETAKSFKKNQVDENERSNQIFFLSNIHIFNRYWVFGFWFWVLK